MPLNHLKTPLAAAVVLSAAVVLGGCSGFPGLSNPEPPPVPEAPAELPSRYSAEEFVGRWGFAAYHKEPDRARTETAARGQCRQPYVIARGPNGGIMMHLADQPQPSELQLKGGPGGRNFIGPPGAGGGPQDREILSFDGRVLITRYLDADAASRYGNMVHVRCAPRA